MLKIILPVLVWASVFLNPMARAQTDQTDEVRSMSLEDLLNISTSVASGSKDKSLTPREAPGIITIITADEIRKRGYRDLADALRMVPGFEVQSGADNQGTLTPSLRGLKAGEGKMLLQVNGFNYTDPSYVNVQIYNRFPVDAIKQIEIIRGPGSAIYGGWAELTVVNVILKDGADLNGFLVSGFGSQMEKASGRRNLLFSMGKKEGDLNYSMHGYFAKAELSDRDFTDERGVSYRFDKQTGYRSKSVNINTTYKDFSARFVNSEYRVESTDDVWGPGVLDHSYGVDFNMMGAAFSYDDKLLDDRLVITPTYEFTRWKVWGTPDEWARTGTTANYYNNDTFDKTRGQLTALYKGNKWWDALVGVETTHYDVTFDNTGWAALGKPFYYSTLGVFTQGTFKLSHFNFTLGARRESTTVNNKSALVPRAGLTALFGDFHFKALYSQAFRTPSATQYLVQQGVIKPENAEVKEVELGYKFTSTQFVTVNFFDIQIKDALRYDNLGYANTDGVGSRGMEVEYKNVQSWGDLDLTGSLYSATKRSFVGAQSTTDNQAFLGIPRYKATLAGTYDITRSLFLSPTLVYEKAMYSKVNINDGTTGYVYSEPEKDLGTLSLNLYLLKSGLFGWKDTELGVGGYNLTGAKTYYPNTINNGQPPPLPGNTREFGLKLTTQF